MMYVKDIFQDRIKKQSCLKKLRTRCFVSLLLEVFGIDETIVFEAKGVGEFFAIGVGFEDYDEVEVGASRLLVFVRMSL